MICSVSLLHVSWRVINSLLLVTIISQGNGPANVSCELAMRVREKVVRVAGYGSVFFVAVKVGMWRLSGHWVATFGINVALPFAHKWLLFRSHYATKWCKTLRDDLMLDPSSHCGGCSVGWSVAVEWANVITLLRGEFDVDSGWIITNLTTLRNFIASIFR